ncbi:unnamed protein product [Larinioides sclopetarius]|uniref:Uncharacterized protein n=1 Tax=Larinioides sclopetarius TaxID=280406 RepID=A0AAV1ZIN3_9ARAC
MDIFSRGISTEIQHRMVLLDFATDIVRFSFIVQSSISYLDLPQQDFPFNYEDFFRRSFSVLDGTIQYPKYLINTEEKCRKILSNTRDFLYRYHLDMPKKREYNLRDGLKHENVTVDCGSRHIAKIAVRPNFYFTVLSSFVEEAVKRSNKKLKMIK